MGDDRYRKAKVWDRAHPEYGAFLEVLRNPVLHDPIVRLGGAEAIMRSEQPPELHIDFETGKITRSSASPLPM